MMIKLRFFRCYAVGILGLLLLSGCATTPPSQPNNVCHIFREKPDWYESAVSMQQEWGLPIQIAMAIVWQESAFRDDALPPKDYLLGFIPYGRVTSAYGYSQAIESTWEQFERATDTRASRSNFEDSLMFIGWYATEAHRKLGISYWDTYNQYLAYHEGFGGFQRKTYRHKPNVISIARRVKQQADNYGWQLKQCRAELDNQ